MDKTLKVWEPSADHAHAPVFNNGALTSLAKSVDGNYIVKGYQ